MGIGIGYAVAAAIVSGKPVVKELPESSTGKVDRHRPRELCSS
jgi:hypothetical protein